jgi:hypothetical protein
MFLNKKELCFRITGAALLFFSAGVFVNYKINNVLEYLRFFYNQIKITLLTGSDPEKKVKAVKYNVYIIIF